ncbi:unnamed protein product [Calypogeia fissa]
MAIPEDIVDLWNEFPLQLKIEPLDDLFNNSPKATPNKKFFEAAVTDDNDMDNASEITDCVITDAFEEVKPMKPLKSQEGKNSLGVAGAENAVVGGIPWKASKLYAYEDFHSFLAREGGLNQERLSRLVDDVSPRPDEDFVSFLARSNGIKDEQMINRLRQALKLEPAIEAIQLNKPVKMEVDSDLKVREGEDAAAFFVRAGSWESASSISEELASVGLDEFADEDAESFFRRTEGIEDSDLDGGELTNGSLPSGAPVALISPKQEVNVLNVVDSPKNSDQVSKPSESNESSPANQQVVVKKRKQSPE